MTGVQTCALPISLPTKRFTCEPVSPAVGGKVAIKSCRLCGFAIGKKDKLTVLSCCDRSCHARCWDTNNRPVACANIVKFLQRDRVTARVGVLGVSTPCISVATKRSRQTYSCNYCGIDVDIDSDDARTHITQKCGAIDAMPACAGDVVALATRLAGATKIRRVSDKAVVHSSGVT